MQPEKKLVKIQSITSPKVLNFTTKTNTTLLSLRHQLKTKQIKLNSYCFLMNDQSPISKTSEPDITLGMILDAKNTFYIREEDENWKGTQHANADVEEQIKRSQKVKGFEEFQGKIEELKKRLGKFKAVFDGKINGLPKVNDNYQGEIKNGQYEGIGRYNYGDGQVFDGEFKNGKRHGLGFYNFKNGDKYQGEYKDNLACGLGIEIFHSGDSMSATYKNNNSNGTGIFYFANGQKLVGQFVENNFDGEGYRIYPDGTFKVERYVNGYLNVTD